MRVIGVSVLAILLAAVCFIGYFAWKHDVSLSGILPLFRNAPALPPAGEPLPFTVPAGFTARVYSNAVPGVRAMTRDPRGTLIASLTGEGTVVALPDEDGDGVADTVATVVDGLHDPHGLAFICAPTSADDCTLYIAEEDAVRAYAYDASTRTAQVRDSIVTLPSGKGHSTRSLLPHPDGKRLLVAIGSSCNVCEEQDERRAAILVVDPTAKKSEVFATGLRNTVFMAIHPVTGEIWGTDMGRDLLGDDLPPDEVNIIRAGAAYGWPWYYGDNVLDRAFRPGDTPPARTEPVASHIDLQAHSAPLGLAFIPEEGWPEEYWYDLLVAFHGSWNRSVPTGYKVVRIPLDARGAPEGPHEDFMSGFLREDGVIGRPADVRTEPGGVTYVSDDRAGAIYRITRDTID